MSVRPVADRFLTSQPSEEDVAGTYVIDANSQKRNIKLPQNNGTFPIGHSHRLFYQAITMPSSFMCQRIIVAKLRAR